jgi:hypothetical protein
MNNRSNSLNGGNLDDLWVMKSPCSKACESECDYPWQNICHTDDKENLPSVTSLVTRK